MIKLGRFAPSEPGSGSAAGTSGRAASAGSSPWGYLVASRLSADDNWISKRSVRHRGTWFGCGKSAQKLEYAVEGYSGTPLAKKLGYQAGNGRSCRQCTEDYAALVAPLPNGVVISSKAAKELDLVHIFSKSRRTS